MARSFNKVIIVGNLVKDPETSTTSQGKTISRVRLAVDDSFKDNKRTYFFDVICWERLGELVSKYTKKGDRILIEGRLTQSSWKSVDQNGNEITKRSTGIVAENVLLLSPKQKEDKDVFQSKQGSYADFVNNQQYKETIEGETFEESLIEDIQEDYYFDDSEEPDYSELDDEYNEEENIKNIDTKREFDI